MKKYVILGENNYWYSLFVGTKKQLTAEIKRIKSEIKKGNFDDPLKPACLYIYEATETKRVKV